MFRFRQFLLKIKETWLVKFQFILYFVVLGQAGEIYMVTNHLFTNAS